MSRQSQQQREAAGNLMKWLSNGVNHPSKAEAPKVYSITRHTSRSGLRRVVQLLTFNDDARPVWIGRSAATLMGYRYDEKREGISCYNDSEIVTNLSAALFGNASVIEHISL